MAVDSIRTCSGCGEKAHPDELERFVLIPEVGILHDLRKKAPGRGAHVHAEPGCIAKAAKFGFSRAFRQSVDAPDGNDLVVAVRDGISQRLDEAARIAKRSQAAAVGQAAVAEAMRRDEAGLVFLASDASDATRTKFGSNADRKRINVIDRFDGRTLGGWTGREFVSVLTVSEPLATRLLRDCRNLERLGFFEG